MVRDKNNKMSRVLFKTYLLTLSLFVLIISSFLLTNTKKAMIKEVALSRKDVLKQVSERANVVKNSSITVSNLFALDEEVLRILNEDQISDKAHHDHYLTKLKQSFDLVFEDVGIAYDVVLMGENGYNYASHAQNFYDFKSLKDQLWFKSIYEKNGDITFISSFKDHFGAEQDRYVFSASRDILNKEGERLGTLMINIDEDYLYNLYEILLEGDNTIYIIDSKGNVISHTDKAVRGLNYFDMDKFKTLYPDGDYHIIKKSDGPYLFSSYQDLKTSWVIIEEIPAKSVFREVNNTIFLLVLVMILCLLIGLLISYMIAQKLTQPLEIINDSVSEIKKGNLDNQLEIESYDEVNKIRDNFNQMSKEIKDLLQNIKEQEEYRRDIELNFLRAQINPHFLYNTLFSIKCMAEMDKKEELLVMIDSFMDLLKVSFSGDSEVVTLAKEIEATEKYLKLQQFRYGNKFTYTFEVDDALRQHKLPALLLQPIVENAIFHGIEAKEDYGHITVHVYSDHKDYYIIDVIDDGLGMCEDKIKAITDQFGKFEIAPQKTIGIANVANRLMLTYGPAYNLSIISELYEGTIIRLKIPKEEGEAYESNHCR
ncbi:MAG TPA: sensor histidine kinase [Erysipelothrix sp.]